MQDAESEQLEFSIKYQNQDGDPGQLAKAVAYLNSHLQKFETQDNNMFISLKIVYSDETPIDYKPPGFMNIETISSTEAHRFPIYQLRTSDNHLVTLSRIKLNHESPATRPKIMNVDKIIKYNAMDAISECSSIDKKGISSTDVISKITEILCQGYDIPIDVMKIVCPTLFFPNPERASRSNDSTYAIKSMAKNEANDQLFGNVLNVPIKIEETNDYELRGNTKCMCNAMSTDSEQLIQCCKCFDWDHAICYGYWRKSTMMLQTTHICFACKKKGGDIFPVIDHNHFSELCIYRRGLHILWTKGWFKSIAKISYMMGVDVIQARSVQNKLKRTEFLFVDKSRNPHCVRTDKLETLLSKLINPKLLLGSLDLEVERRNLESDVRVIPVGTEPQSHEPAFEGNQDLEKRTPSAHTPLEYHHSDKNSSIRVLKVALSEITLALL
ncbi:hypothetical protein INT44_005294 [Umbelopsis vinacea]|uniref:HORMA domain-containing protein n=1 Tax=Umbelopsis vinacea TaxID=44442 RepID=A0A8H7Q948_9FUNG|nr:hypothetical protein INT44_005294 [Umbelopsis vinacea]